MKAVNIEWDTDGEDVDLPTEIEIPEGLTDEEEISDYLSDLTGYCHLGFYLDDLEEPKIIMNFHEVKSFKEVHEMLQSMTFEDLISLWEENWSINDSEEDFPSIERIGNEIFYDSDLETFEEMLSQKGIKCELNSSKNLYEITDVDGTTYSYKYEDKENRFGNDLPNETHIYIENPIIVKN